MALQKNQLKKDLKNFTTIRPQNIGGLMLPFQVRYGSIHSNSKKASNQGKIKSENSFMDKIESENLFMEPIKSENFFKDKIKIENSFKSENSSMEPIKIENLFKSENLFMEPIKSENSFMDKKENDLPIKTDNELKSLIEEETVETVFLLALSTVLMVFSLIFENAPDGAGLFAGLYLFFVISIFTILHYLYENIFIILAKIFFKTKKNEEEKSSNK